mmetsp:Transcript_23786/g.53678  ORF Transcript_23786/g.53678 Transcript_23786/m.53678 type:complete len:114 (+) Transcript_23786:181-522(+)|eukprot:CAMPEP_0172617198 /NCGR_PEP_ID=MMETSP1068-20121228/70097_1 /TAXON_ID=35684 /ORGANISM="Pseudopedinella elastica, Strain CCMP716" /LENGTH=113 /DNA_ID=CAMNT_0013422897 /DNA_START=161 /DNA_END=502 /DNA_ORIENTATION=-
MIRSIFFVALSFLLVKKVIGGPTQIAKPVSTTIRKWIQKDTKAVVPVQSLPEETKNQYEMAQDSQSRDILKELDAVLETELNKHNPPTAIGDVVYLAYHGTLLTKESSEPLLA